MSFDRFAGTSDGDVVWQFLEGNKDYKGFPAGSGQDRDMMRRLGLGSGVEEGVVGRWTLTVGFDFELEKRYYSRDDRCLYPVPSPIRRDWVFRVPVIPGSTWKGALRQAARYVLLGSKEKNWKKRLHELFGPRAENEVGLINTGGSGEELYAGRVACVGTMVDPRGVILDVVYPMKVRVPVFMECLKPDTKVRFELIYGAERLGGLEAAARGEMISADLDLIGAAIEMMLSTSGVGAKKKWSLGLAKTEVTGLEIHAGAGLRKAEKAEKAGAGGAIKLAELGDTLVQLWGKLT